MLESVHLTFYRVHHCGYFRRGKDKPEFGEFPSTVTDLREWLSNRVFGSTTTFSPDVEDDVTQIYCLSIDSQDNNDCLLTLWNATAGASNSIASVDRQALVGSATVATHTVPGDRIPGFPTRFWIMPSERIIASIRMKDAKSNQAGFGRYLDGFLRTISSHVVKENGDGESDVVITGYREKPDGELEDVHPKFALRIINNPTKLDEIRDNYGEIRQLARREELPHSIPIKRGTLHRMLTSFGLTSAASFTDDVKVRFQVRFEPTRDQVDEIIQHWEETDAHSKYDDVGFIMKGRSSPVWLSHSYERKLLKIDVKRKGQGEDIDSRALLVALSKYRDEVIARLVRVT